MTKRSSGPVTEREVLIPSGQETVAGTHYDPVEFDDPLPVLLMSIPYRKDDYITYGAYDPTIRYLARNGYHVVVTDLIGTGASSGFKDEHTAFRENEAEDVIAWLADQEWSNGRVGMFGKSYGGRTTLTAAARRPDALEAVVPICTPFSPYDDAKYQGGAVNFFKQIGDWTARMHMLATTPPSRRDSDGRWASVWQERLDTLEDHEPWLFEFLEHDTKDEYWQGKEIDAENIDVPVFAITGWRDYYPYASLEQLSDVDTPVRILIGPWRHTMPHRGVETAINGRERILQWFDRFLKDRETGALDRPPIEYWTERDGGGENGCWRGRDSWPTVTEEGDLTLTFALTPDGLSPAEDYTDGHVEAEYEFDQTVGVNSIDYAAPRMDTTPDDVRSLTFETPPLEQSVELTGTGCAHIRLVPTVRDHLFVVRVIDIDPDGKASLVNFGRVKASLRRSYANPEYLTPGEEFTIDLPIKPKSHVFEAGHKIRVAISAAYFPLMLAPRSHGSFTVLSSPERPSFVQFPGTRHDRDVRFDDTIEMAPPDTESIPVHSPWTTMHDSTWDINRDHQNGTVSFETRVKRTIDPPHGGTMRWRRTVEASVREDDPLSAIASSRGEILLEYDSETVEVETTSRASRDAAQISERVHIDDQLLYDNTWRWGTRG